MENFIQVKNLFIQKDFYNFLKTQLTENRLPSYIDYTLNLLCNGHGISEKSYDEIFAKIETIEPDDDGYLIINNNQKMKFGKLIFKIAKISSGQTLRFGNVSNGIELFIDSYKSWYNYKKELEFQILEGGDVLYIGYNSDYYTRTGFNSLQSSCMNKSYYSLRLYEQNPDKVKLLILKDKNNEIYGRSLIWNLDNRPFQFMDRVYISNTFISNIFKQYAIDNKIAYRSGERNYDFSIYIPDNYESKKGEVAMSYEFPLNVKLDIKNIKQFPYMDSLYYWDSWGDILSNNRGRFSRTRKLDSISGYGRSTNSTIKIFGIKIY